MRSTLLKTQKFTKTPQPATCFRQVLGDEFGAWQHQFFQTQEVAAGQHEGPDAAGVLVPQQEQGGGFQGVLGTREQDQRLVVMVIEVDFVKSLLSFGFFVVEYTSKKLWLKFKNLTKFLYIVSKNFC